MAEPSNITGNAATIYSADLLYEQNCKCGTTEIIMGESSFDYSSKGDYGWKMVALADGTTCSTFNLENMILADNVKLASVTFPAGFEIIGQIAEFACTTGGWIVYKDCQQS